MFAAAHRPTRERVDMGGNQGGGGSGRGDAYWAWKYARAVRRPGTLCGERDALTARARSQGAVRPGSHCHRMTMAMSVTAARGGTAAGA